MRPSVLLFASVAAAIPSTIQEAIQDIPSCSYTAFGQALDSAGCTKSGVTGDTISCMCTQLATVAGTIPQFLSDAACVTSFATAFGTACGVWQINENDSSQVSAGAQALASEVGGSVSSAASSVAATTTVAAVISSAVAASSNGAVGASSVAATSAASVTSVSLAQSTSKAVGPMLSQASGVSVASASGSSTGGAAMVTAGALFAPVVAVAAVLL